MNCIKKIIAIAVAAAMSAGIACAAKTNARTELGRPDLEAISKASVDENSKFYYPRLLKSFMANDTTMTPEEFQYFYYGTMFQEDYDPYREAPNQALLQELLPIYAKKVRTRADRGKMLDYAMQVLEDNPVDLRQLTNRIYVYEQNRKYDLARIWQYKLNHLLLVYPQHEYDFLNLSGKTASSQRFEPPYYDFIAVSQADKKSEGFYFDISELLNQYFIKHPSELNQASGADR